MQITLDFAVIAAITTVISTTTAVLSARAVSKKYQHEKLAQIVRTVVLEHQTSCPVGEQLRTDAQRDRQEMLRLMESVQTELRAGIRHLTGRLDAIYTRMGAAGD